MEGCALGQVLHGSARTTAAVRRAIQHSEESLRALAKRHSINQKTVAKWKKRETVVDRPTGPTDPRSTVLSLEEEAIVVAFRRHTLLPLDDCLYALQATIPHLTRSSLHRCLQRHGIARLPDTDGDKPSRSRSKAHPIRYHHAPPPLAAAPLPATPRHRPAAGHRRGQAQALPLQGLSHRLLPRGHRRGAHR